MTLEETSKILAVIKKEYPHAFKDLVEKKDKMQKLEFWQRMFANDDYSVVGAAVEMYIATDTTGFAPVIGQIKENIRKLTQPEEMSEQEAVNLILKAATRGIYNSQEEFDKLPPICQRLVGTPKKLKEWAMMDVDTLNSVVASNLMRSYKAVAQKEKEYQALPSNVKVLLEGAKSKMMLKEGEDDG